MQKSKIIIQLQDYEQVIPKQVYAIHLAKALNKPVILQSAERLEYSEVPAAIVGSGIDYPPVLNMERIRAKAFKALEKFTHSAKEIWPKIEHEVVIGFPESTLIESSESDEAYLLTIEAENGLTNFNEWFGTYETRMAENADCPVLIVPQDLPWHPPKKLLYIMDMADAKVENMRYLVEMTNRLDCDLQVVVISEDPFDDNSNNFKISVDIFRNFLGYRDATFYQVFGQKRSQKVENLIHTLRPDWFVFEKKNKFFLERIIDDYNTKRLILQSDIPVLVF